MIVVLSNKIINLLTVEEYQTSALQRATDNAEEQLRSAVSMMSKKLTAQQHLKGLLSASLRQEQPPSDMCMIDEVDFDAEASADELALFEALREYDLEIGELFLYCCLLGRYLNCYENVAQHTGGSTYECFSLLSTSGMKIAEQSNSTLLH